MGVLLGLPQGHGVQDPLLPAAAESQASRGLTAAEVLPYWGPALTGGQSCPGSGVVDPLALGHPASVKQAGHSPAGLGAFEPEPWPAAAVSVCPARALPPPRTG